MEELDPSDVCLPITDFSDVLNWKCDGKCWIHKHTVADLTERTNFMNCGSVLDTREKAGVYSEYKWASRLLPKTVFCHDYKGGYVEDKYCNGSANINTYRFFNWAGIDLFIYFSHHLVTIPTQGWLNAGHIHGVPVLGTFITEWTEGETVWRKILTDINKINMFAQKLAEICAHFRFDGYLLNVENVIPKDFVPRLIQFVALLKANLDLFCGKRTWLIWYDSVTMEGNLSWQNKLCPLNKPFFDACDGIFLNYVWTPADLLESIELAGSRKFDVFVGVDVYGRNCYQDGGLSVDKALAVLRSQKMSVALFAPGWTFEKLSVEEQFLSKETWFWKTFWPYLFIHGPAFLPFSTNFCQGISFNKESGDPLFNLGLQQYQPTAQSCSANPCTEESCISLCLEDGVEINGACLKIKEGPQTHSKKFHRVFSCSFGTDEKTPMVLQITLSLKNCVNEPASKFRVFFVLEDKISVEGKKAVSMTKRPKGYRASTRIEKLIVAGSLMDFTAERQTTETKIKVQTNKSYCNKQNASTGWENITFLVNVNDGASLTEILLLPPPEGSVLWGLLEVKKLETYEVEEGNDKKTTSSTEKAESNSSSRTRITIATSSL